MDKKNECKSLSDQLDNKINESDNYKQKLNAEMMRSEALNQNDHTKYDDLLSKNANKDVQVEKLLTEIRKLSSDNQNQSKT